MNERHDTSNFDSFRIPNPEDLREKKDDVQAKLEESLGGVQELKSLLGKQKEDFRRACEKLPRTVIEGLKDYLAYEGNLIISEDDDAGDYSAARRDQIKGRVARVAVIDGMLQDIERKL